jgi:hypothetical protein
MMPTDWASMGSSEVDRLHAPSAIILSLRTLLYPPFILLCNLIWDIFIYYSEDNENDLAPL